MDAFPLHGALRIGRGLIDQTAGQIAQGLLIGALAKGSIVGRRPV